MPLKMKELSDQTNESKSTILYYIKEGLLPDIPNIRTLWAEQLRTIKFEQWIAQNF